MSEPKKHIAVYADPSVCDILRSLGFGHGWPTELLAPVLDACVLYFQNRSITSYDPTNIRELKSDLAVALAKFASLPVVEPPPLPTAKLPKRGRNVTRTTA